MKHHKRHSVIHVAVLLAACSGGAGIQADELPARAPGLWQLVKQVEDEPRPLPAVLQCSDSTTDQRLGGRAFLASTDPCAQIEVVPETSSWRIEAQCDTAAGPMRETTLLTGDFETSYRMEQTASIAGMQIRQTVVARRLGDCQPGQRAGMVYINGMGFDLSVEATD
ncbi:MAG: DUF3617 family protein [Pseudomonadales bacterium]